ncbi:YIP1 family protein [Nereida sp. MMG025]|uniref:YIP1 family protein n=1 Tax=Nereida sp. MMG025 TaxID=2909981 RepID=UPI001F0305B4|nr:YIP1 family protein [Nereida sp. MMG025]MCF6443136.1 YIP1 family protein [Nereida sp. MMG025]
MTIGLAQLQGLFRLTWQDPREGAHAVLSMPMPRNAVWLSVAFVAVLSALLSGVSQELFPVELPDGRQPDMPWIIALRQFGQLVILIFSVYWGGRMLDGRGSLPEVAIVLTWLQLYSLPFQIGVIILVTIAPLLGAFMFMVVAGYLLYLLVTFIDIAHALGSVWKAAKMLILVIVGLALGLSLLLTLVNVSA